MTLNSFTMFIHLFTIIHDFGRTRYGTIISLSTEVSNHLFLATFQLWVSVFTTAATATTTATTLQLKEDFLTKFERFPNLWVFYNKPYIAVWAFYPTRIWLVMLHDNCIIKAMKAISTKCVIM